MYRPVPLVEEGPDMVIAWYEDDKYREREAQGFLCYAETLKDVMVHCSKRGALSFLVHPLTHRQATEEILEALGSEDANGIRHVRGMLLLTEQHTQEMPRVPGLVLKRIFVSTLSPS